MASQGSKLWEGKNMGEPNRRCSKICHAAHLSALSLVIMVFSPPGIGDQEHLHKGEFMSCF